MRKNKTQTLRHAAALVFALTAALPLLMFTYTLYRLNGIREIEDQVMLGLALMAALVGFRILRAIMVHLSDLAKAIGNLGGEEKRLTRPPERNLRVPGIGTIQEFDKITETLWPIWKTESESCLGERVLVSVKNSPSPIAGFLLEVTDDGLLLEEDGQQVGVSYRRISGIERDGVPDDVPGIGVPVVSSGDAHQEPR